MRVEPMMYISNAASSEKVVSKRYKHRHSRATAPRVTVQWSRSGYGMYEDAGGEQQVNEGHAFVMTLPDEVGYFYPQEGKETWVIDWIDFTGSLAGVLFQGFKKRFGAVVPLGRNGPAGILLTRLIRRWQAGEREEHLETSKAIYAFLLEWSREAERRTPVGRLVEIAEATLSNKAHRFTTVKEMAHDCHLSREHFTRVFRQQQGISPASWLRARRLALARDLICSNPALTLASIARETGFDSGRHLSGCFRRAFGMTVESFRSSISQ